MHAGSTRRMHDLGPALSGWLPVRWPEAQGLAAWERTDTGFRRVPDTYAVTMVCSNCGHHWTAHIPRGEPAGRKSCPHCGCYTGHKTWQPGPPRRDITWTSPKPPVTWISPKPPVTWIHPRYRERG